MVAEEWHECESMIRTYLKASTGAEEGNSGKIIDEYGRGMSPERGKSAAISHQGGQESRDIHLWRAWSRLVSLA